MFKHIEKMRQKSDAEKVRYILGVSLGITSIIAAFWAVSFAVRLNNGSVSFEIDATEGKGIKDIGGRIGDSWGKFFPKSEQATTSSTITPSAADDTFPAPAVILDQPEFVEPYPADVY